QAQPPWPRLDIMPWNAGMGRGRLQRLVRGRPERNRTSLLTPGERFATRRRASRAGKWCRGKWCQFIVRVCDHVWKNEPTPFSRSESYDGPSVCCSAWLGVELCRDRGFGPFAPRRGALFRIPMLEPKQGEADQREQDVSVEDHTRIPWRKVVYSDDLDNVT